MLSFLTGRRRAARSVRDVLEDLGVEAAEIESAEADGTDELLAIDRVVLPGAITFTIAELADEVGVEVEFVRRYWRALGFADVPAEEAAFSDKDLQILETVTNMIANDVFDADRGLQMTRVLGLSMAQVASALVEGTEARSVERREAVAEGNADATARYDAASLAVRADDVLPFYSDVIDYVFRHHLRAAARNQITLAKHLEGEGQAVGFADMARFTQMSASLDDQRLASLVARFDHLANDIVAGHGGRIVKMIGDEAMFTVTSATAAAHIALDLTQRVALDEQLSDVRVGLATGPVLARDGDLYGPVVNLASRLAELGRPRTVMVSQAFRDAIAHDHSFQVRSAGVKRLRHIGEVRVYRLRSASRPPS